MSYYGEAARVERCPPHTASYHEDYNGNNRKFTCTIASSAFKPCHNHGTHSKHLWTRCHVTNELEVFFHSSAPSTVLTKKGIKSKNKTPNFYRIVCGNLKELCSLNKQFTVPLSSDAVLSSDFSYHSLTESPQMQGGEAHAPTAAPRGSSGGVSAFVFPTVALLVAVGPFSELFLLLLTPVEIPMKKGESVLSYRALMRRASAAARIVLVAPCGDCVYVLSPSLERRSDDPAGDGAADTVACGGSYLSLATARPSKLLQPLLLSMRLHEVLANSCRRVLDIVGTPFTYGQCLCAPDGQRGSPRQGGTRQLHEIVLFSGGGWAFNFRLSEMKNTKGTDTAHFVCYHPYTYAHKVQQTHSGTVDKVNALCATIWSFRQRWNVSMWYTDACAQERQRQPFASGLGGKANQRASHVLACSANGRLVLTCSRSDPGVGFITNVPCSYSKTSRHASVYFPRDAVIHDAIFVEEEKHMGFLLLCRAVNHAGPGAGVVQCPHPWLRDTEASSMQLWFVPLGGGACEQIHISSFRNWNECPSSFLYSSFSVLRFASVDSREDSALHGVWEVKVRSSTCDDVILVALAALPSMASLLRCRANESDAAISLPRFIRYLVFFYVCNAESLRACEAVEAGVPTEEEIAPLSYDNAEIGVLTGSSSESKVLALEARLKQYDGKSEYVSHLAYLRVLVTFLKNTFLYNSESETFDEVLCACIVNVFRGVAEGWRSFTGVRTVESTTWKHVLFFHHCVAALKNLLDLLQNNGAVSAVTACLSHISHYLKEDVANTRDPRHILCARLFDQTYPSVVQLPPLSADVLRYVNPSLADVLATAKKWLEEEENMRVLTVGDAQVPLKTVNAYGNIVKPLKEVLECVKAGPTRMATINVADMYWAARRLFLQESPQAAVSLLEQISAMGQRDQSLTELLALYQNLSERVRLLKA